METLKNEIHTKHRYAYDFWQTSWHAYLRKNKLRKSYSESHRQMVSSAPTRDGILGLDDDNDVEEREEENPYNNHHNKCQYHYEVVAIVLLVFAISGN